MSSISESRKPFDEKKYFDDVFDIMKRINDSIYKKWSKFDFIKEQILDLLRTSSKVLRFSEQELNSKLQSELQSELGSRSKNATDYYYYLLTKNNNLKNKLEELKKNLTEVTNKEELKIYFAQIVRFEEYYKSKMDGGRRNKSKYAEVKMKDIKELCKANNIKLSRVVNDKRVVYKKKELLTKLKRKKII